MYAFISMLLATNPHTRFLFNQVLVLQLIMGDMTPACHFDLVPHLPFWLYTLREEPLVLPRSMVAYTYL
jgi:hypothetical protein